MPADKDFDELVRIFNGPSDNLERISHYVKREIEIKQAEVESLIRLGGAIRHELTQRQFDEQKKREGKV